MTGSRVTRSLAPALMISTTGSKPCSLQQVCFLGLVYHFARDPDIFWLLSTNPCLVAFIEWPLMNSLLWKNMFKRQALGIVLYLHMCSTIFTCAAHLYFVLEQCDRLGGWCDYLSFYLEKKPHEVCNGPQVGASTWLLLQGLTLLCSLRARLNFPETLRDFFSV